MPCLADPLQKTQKSLGVTNLPFVCLFPNITPINGEIIRKR